MAIDLVLAALDEAYDRKSWHGTNLRGSLRSVDAPQALWRPGPGRHNIWEIAVHAAYWKYCVWRKLSGAAPRSFPLAGSNYFPRETGSAAEWKQDLARLAGQHQQLRAAVAALNPAWLNRKAPKSRYTYAVLLRGIAAHDLYHAGQIQLLKRLAAPRSGSTAGSS